MRATPKKCPRPTGPLSEKQIALFHARGFLSLEQISSPAEIRILGPVFERLFQESAGRSEGNHYDLVGHDDDDVLPTLPSIINPVNYAPRLRNLAFRRNAFSIAQQLLGPSVTPAFEQAILKPARYGAATPWHQDEAYRRCGIRVQSSQLLDAAHGCRYTERLHAVHTAVESWPGLASSLVPRRPEDSCHRMRRRIRRS
jgi:hypothetical protein